MKNYMLKSIIENIVLMIFCLSFLLVFVYKKCVYISAVKRLIASKIKVFVYLIHECVLYLFIIYIYICKHMHVCI